VAMFFGVGALFVPALAASAGGRFAILATAAVTAACATGYLILRFPAPAETGGFSLLASLKAARNPGAMLFAVLLFLESGSEASIGGWTSTYVGAMGSPARTATIVLAGYWAALIAGRLAAARLPRSTSKTRLVVLSGIGSAAGCALLLISASPAVMFAGAAITGASQAAIYPATLAIAADRYQRNAGTIFGFLFAAGLSGGMLFPWSIGRIAPPFGLRAAMLLPLFGGVLIAMLAAAIARRFTATPPIRIG